MHQQHVHINSKTFQQDIDNLRRVHPGLHSRISAGGDAIVEGVVEIKDDQQKVMDSFTVRLIYPSAYPYCYPKVIETGGRFSKSDGRLHINGDGTLCLKTLQLEKIDCFNAIDSSWFVDNILLGNLAWRVCVLEGIPADLKEFGHGTKGVVETYELITQSNDLPMIVLFLKKFVTKSLPQRNDKCFCRSDKKYKNCHGRFESDLIKIGNTQLTEDFVRLENYVTPHKP